MARDYEKLTMARKLRWLKGGLPWLTQPQLQMHLLDPGQECSRRGHGHPPLSSRRHCPTRKPAHIPTGRCEGQYI